MARKASRRSTRSPTRVLARGLVVAGLVCWAARVASAGPCLDPAWPDHRSYTAEAIRALSAPNDALNLVVGDSIAERWPADDVARWMGGPVQNLGVSGDTPHGLLWRLQQMRGPRRWRRILLIVGVNGAGSEPTCHDVAASIEADRHALHRLAPAARVVVLGVMPLGPGLDAYLPQVNGIDAALARDAKAGGFTLLDVNDGLLAACEGRSRCPLLADWLHPTLAGYDRIGPLVQAAFADGVPAR